MDVIRRINFLNRCDTFQPWLAILPPHLLAACALLLAGCHKASVADPQDPAQPVPSMLPGRSGEVIWQACELCHSGKEMQRGPILNGLPAWYLENQLAKFQAGIRGNSMENRSAALMAAAMSQIQSQIERTRVVQYIAQLPRPAQLVTVPGNADHGAVVYQTCVPCHGPNGGGDPLKKSPPIHLLEDWYMIDQLRKFKAGLRGADLRDQEGFLMRPVIMPLSDQDLRDVTRFIATKLAPADIIMSKAKP